ncbi:Protein involved in inorganic phosphate transport [Trachipleistophora hominis]|uniref:Protein involved in inorganic phosphate transport n=1 Tax=Trachipleistophora hominis TaxID=72359 RepID=L7JRX9_TRAHO|nr:Protein involved in inorganic phosphate transport [Trachipleistophora hominis]
MEIPLTSIDQALNIVASLVCMQATKYVELSHPLYLWTLRVLYVISQLMLFLCVHLIKKSIMRQNDRRVVKVPRELKWNEVPETNEEEFEEITYSEYDMREAGRLIKSALFQIPIVLFLHLKFGLPQPLALQAISIVKSFFLNPLFIAHLRHKSVLRPFDKNMLFGKAKEDGEERRKREDEDVVENRDAAKVEDGKVKDVTEGVVSLDKEPCAAKDQSVDKEADENSSTKRREE